MSKISKTGLNGKLMKPELEHLTLVPISGMCNRLRAIASARRLCSILHARCSIIWDWGDFQSFFMPIPEAEICRVSHSFSNKRMRHLPLHVDPTRTVDVTVKTIELHSGFVFWGSHESKISLGQVKSYIPKLSIRLQEAVDSFSRSNLIDVVGFHMRRTDHKKSIRYSPDEMFIERAKSIINSGKRIFLATDNIQTELLMKRHFGLHVVTFPKRQSLERRWPRVFDQIAAEDDLVELFLLAKTEFIVGSYFSSFSGMAIALNGSKKNEILCNTT